MQQRYLITGGQGFVARYLGDHLLREDESARVMGIGRSGPLDGFFTHLISVNGTQVRAPLPSWIRSAWSGRLTYERASILDTPKLRHLLQTYQPTCIFHLASGLWNAGEHHLVRTNIEGTLSVLEAVAEASSPKPLVLLGSSGGVYGAIKEEWLPVRESVPCEPVETYAATKLAAENLTRIKSRLHSIPFIVARIFNIAGPGQDESHVCGRFAAHLATAHGASDGTLTTGSLQATRDFIDVRDVVRALSLLAQRGDPGKTYNVASGKETSIQEILSQLIRLSGWRGHVSVGVGPHPAEVSRHWADVSRLAKLGFAPAHSIKDTLRDIVSYYRHVRDQKPDHAGEETPRQHDPIEPTLIIPG